MSAERVDGSGGTTGCERVDAFIEASLAPDQAHRSGTLDRVEAMLAEDPGLSSASLHAAVVVGDTDAVAEILRDDPEAAGRAGGPRDWEPLLYLCFSRFLRLDARRAERMVEAARLLLAHGADPNAYWTDPNEAEGNRETPIYGAAGVANNLALTELLLDAGADPNDGETPYHAVEHEGVPCLGLLWEHFDDTSRAIAIQHQVDYPDLVGLRRLLELGANPDNRSRFSGRAPLHGCVFRGHGRAHFELLFEYGADPNVVDDDGRTPYAWAARAGQRRIMEILREHGASTELNETDRFLSACALADTETVDELLRQSPDAVERLSAEDRGVICEAAANGNTDGVAAMLDAGFDIDTPGRVWAEGPIHRAGMDGHLDTVKLLFRRGADLMMRDRSYQASPLGWAAHGGHDEIVQFLLQDPSRLDLRDAIEFGKAERAGELLGDVDVDAPIGGGEPGVLLRAAAHGGHEELVELLLARGADPTIRNSEGLRALDYARAQGHQAVVDLLA